MNRNDQIEILLNKSRHLYLTEQKENSKAMVERLFEYCLHKDLVSLEALKRYFHSVKGSAGTMALTKMSMIAEKYENQIEVLISESAEYSRISFIILQGLALINEELDEFEFELNNIEIPGLVEGNGNNAYTSRVLVLDDDKSLVSLIEKVLMQEGYYVYTATESEDALHIFENNRIDLFILDLNMPNISGFDVLRHIKKINNKVPVVLLTGDDRESTKKRALEEGSFDLLVKPFAIKEFIDYVAITIKKFNDTNE